MGATFSVKWHKGGHGFVGFPRLGPGTTEIDYVGVTKARVPSVTTSASRTKATLTAPIPWPSGTVDSAVPRPLTSPVRPRGSPGRPAFRCPA
jgi:hypothetical protein